MKDAHVPFEDDRGVSMSETEKERKLCRWNGRNKSIVQLWLLVVVAIAHVGILASWIRGIRFPKKMKDRGSCQIPSNDVFSNLP